MSDCLGHSNSTKKHDPMNLMNLTNFATLWRPIPAFANQEVGKGDTAHLMKKTMLVLAHRFALPHVVVSLYL